jgi:hypothetical protein
MKLHIATLLLLTGLRSWRQAGEIGIEDLFGRRVNDRGLTLVDWDGFMANPAIKFFVIPPAGTAIPARAVLRVRARVTTQPQPDAHWSDSTKPRMSP